MNYPYLLISIIEYCLDFQFRLVNKTVYIKKNLEVLAVFILFSVIFFKPLLW